jgi:PAS domain S-box-containing protein
MPPLEVWSLVDVTEGHLQRLRLRVLFEQSTNAHLIFDERGIVDCNEAAVRLLRCRDRAELLSTHPAVFSPELQPDGRRSMEKAQEMDATARREGSHRFEWIHRRMDGTDLPVEVTLNPVLLPTGPAMLADWHDITHHLETERALSDARDRALEATRAKSAFLANMSHELRTPLNAIIGYSELIAEAGGVEAWAIPDIERVTSAGRHLLALINDILDLSKIEAGFMTLEPQWFEVAATARSVADTVTPAATANGNAVEVDVGPGVLLIYADATRLRQILLNLLGNAAKFTHDGRIGLRLSAENDAVRVDVWDTGIGMNEEEVGRIFQEFVQADPSTTRRFGGTGLGLAISRRLCVQMGGSISVTSAPGEGSTFTVTLPIGESPDDPR